MAGPDADDLLTFVATDRVRPGFACSVCEFPERAVIDEARRKAKPRTMGGTMVRRWLIARCGYTEDTVPTRMAIDHHFCNGHHLEES